MSWFRLGSLSNVIVQEKIEAMFSTISDFLQNQEHPMFNIDNLSLGLISSLLLLVCKKLSLYQLCMLYYFYSHLDLEGDEKCGVMANERLT